MEFENNNTSNTETSFNPGMIPTNEAEADQLLNHYNSSDENNYDETINEGSEMLDPDTNLPVNRNKDEVKESIKDPTAKTAPTSDMFELLRGNEKVQLPKDKVIEYAQKGFETEVKMRNFQRELQSFQNQKAEFEKNYGVIREIENYAKQNPGWMQHVQESWNKLQKGDFGNELERGQEQGINNEFQNNPIINSLKKELSEIKGYLDQQKQFEQEWKTRETEQKLNETIDKVKSTYKDFDWNSKDEFGENLEDRIINHAVSNNIATFQAAAKDYLFDQILAKKTMAVKEETAKQIQKTNKFGLSPITFESQKKAPVKASTSVRSKSYDDLMSEAYKELGM